MSEQEHSTNPMYGLKTTGGQEKTVAGFIEKRARQQNMPIYAIIALDRWKGYIVIESSNAQVVDESIQGFKHVRGKIPGMMRYAEEIEKYLIEKSMVAELNEGDTVEIVSGPFKSMRAKITRVEKEKQEVTVVLLDTPYQMPISLDAAYVALKERAKTEPPR